MQREKCPSEKTEKKNVFRQKPRRCITESFTGKKKKHEQIYQRDQTDCQVKPAKAGESEEEKKGQQVITF